MPLSHKSRVISGSIDVLEARRLFAYCSSTGAITRRISLGGQLAEASVGTKRKDGYLEVRLGGRSVLLHRLAWAIHYGAESAHEIDHLDGDRSHNAISNLREADRTINNQNRRAPHRNNRLGVLGVQRTASGRFKARIRVNSRLIDLGVHDTEDQASAAYLCAKRQLHKGNTL